jgi:hypothetical protein
MRRLLMMGFSAWVLGLAACSAPPPVDQASSGPEPDTPVQDIMNNVMAPALDEAFILPDILTDAAAAKAANPGDVDAAWARVKHGAVTLTEIPNLVVIPGRRITKPGGSVTGESGGGYLRSAEIEARFRDHRPELLKAARKLQEAGLVAQAAAARRDAKALLDLGIDIEVVCEGCHKQFWYSPKVAESAEQ